MFALLGCGLNWQGIAKRCNFNLVLQVLVSDEVSAVFVKMG